VEIGLQAKRENLQHKRDGKNNKGVRGRNVSGAREKLENSLIFTALYRLNYFISLFYCFPFKRYPCFCCFRRDVKNKEKNNIRM
jgi:hypothetical protein